MKPATIAIVTALIGLALFVVISGEPPERPPDTAASPGRPPP